MIKSKYATELSTLSKRKTEEMLSGNYANCIMDNLSRDFVAKHPECSFEEMKNAARYGFWKGMQSYKPDKGKFGTYVRYVCLSYMNSYYRFYTGHIRCKKESEIVDSMLSTNGTEKKANAKIMVSKILSKMSEENRKILESIMDTDAGKWKYGAYETCAAVFGLSRFKFDKKLKSAIEEARSHVEKELCVH